MTGDKGKNVLCPVSEVQLKATVVCDAGLRARKASSRSEDLKVPSYYSQKDEEGWLNQYNHTTGSKRDEGQAKHERGAQHRRKSML
jgi:hypothetical protein